MAFPKLDEIKDQEAFEKAIQAAIEGEVGGLKRKKETLEGEIRDLKDRLEPFKDLDPKEVAETLREAKRLRDKQHADAGEWEKIRDQMREDHQKELEKRDTEIANLRGGNDKLRKRTAIEEAIRGARIAEPFVEAVEAMLDSKIVIDGDGDKRTAKIGDKSPSEYLSEFVATDKGKHYVAAEANSGGGAPGSGVPGFKGKNPFDPKAPNVTEQMKLRKENPELADKLRKQAGQKSA